MRNSTPRFQTCLGFYSPPRETPEQLICSWWVFIWENGKHIGHIPLMWMASWTQTFFLSKSRISRGFWTWGGGNFHIWERKSWQTLSCSQKFEYIRWFFQCISFSQTPTISPLQKESQTNLTHTTLPSKTICLICCPMYHNNWGWIFFFALARLWQPDGWGFVLFWCGGGKLDIREGI